MDMKLDSLVIRSEREKRAWSQEHLAGVSGLGLRTIQRIESTGSASYESAGALAAVFEVPVVALRGAEVESGTPGNVSPGRSVWHRILTVFGCAVLGAILSRPNYRENIAVIATLWIFCEIAIRTAASDRRPTSF